MFAGILQKSGILGASIRVTGLNQRDTQQIQGKGDFAFIIKGMLNAFSLCTVT